MHDTLTALHYPADLEARLRTLPATIAAPAAARLGDAVVAEQAYDDARRAGDEDAAEGLYRIAERAARSAEVHAAMDALEGSDAPMPCGCVDYHMSDCPTRG